MPTANQFIAKAASQIGVTEYPPNSNKVKYAEWYGMNGQPWCDMFVSWCADQIGALDIVGKYAYTPSHAQFFKNKGQWLDRSEKPQPGDLVFFSNSERICHVGIVETRNGSTSITTIEGNTSAGNNANGGAVMRRNRTYGSVGSNWWIVGFGRPSWDGTTSSSTSTPSTPTISKPTTATPTNWIARLQTECNIQGFSNQKVDGIAGSNTLAGCPTLKKGSRGTITKIMQQRLIDLGYSCGTYGADGINGASTQEAIKRFQRDKGLTVDGIVGRNTWRKLLGL